MLWRSASTRASALPLASFHISCRFSESPGKCCLIEERFGLCEHIGSKVLHHAPMPSFGQASSRLGDERDGPHGNEPLTHRADGSRAAAAKDTGATDDVSQRDPHRDDPQGRVASLPPARGCELPRSRLGCGGS